jgi:hypothetical protein
MSMPRDGCTLRLDDPITLRDLLTYTLGTDMVPAEPGTVPVADALNTLSPAPGCVVRSR